MNLGEKVVHAKYFMTWIFNVKYARGMPVKAWTMKKHWFDVFFCAEKKYENLIKKVNKKENLSSHKSMLKR